VQATRSQLDLSFPIAFPPLPPHRLGAVGPQSWPSYKGPIAKLGRSGLKIGAFNSSCKSVKSVSFCWTCPGMPDQRRLAWSNRFAQSTAESPYTLQWNAHFHTKIGPFPWGDLNPHLIHSPLGPAKSSTQTASRSVQPFLQGSLVWQTDRPTDRPRYSVSNNRPHLRM